ICHCIVFLPNIFGAQNEISIFLSHVAITISISLLASWLFAVSLTPLLAARIPPPKYVTSDSAVSRLKDRYARVLDWTLRHRAQTMLATLAIVVASIAPMMFVKKDLFPSGGTRRLELQVEANGVYTLDETERAFAPLEKWLYDRKKELEIESVYVWISEQFGGGFRLKLVEEGAELSSDEIMEKIREGLPKIAIGNVNFGGGGQRGGGEGLRVSLVGDSSDELEKLGEVVLPILRGLEGLRDVRSDSGATTREIAVRVDRERAGQYGFSAQEVATFIAIALRGAPLKEFRASEDEVPVWLRFQESDTASVDDLRDFKLRRDDGELVPLLSLVDVRVQDSASAIQRQDRQTSFPIQINVAEGTTAEVARKRVEDALSGLAMPPGYRWSFGGGFEREDEAGKQMVFNLLIALLLIYIVMAALFESLLFPAAILTSIVFSIFGVFWFFWLTGTTFSIMAFIGILILMGVVVNNGIIMVEHINQLRHAGMLRTQALIEGSRERLRPVLMTMGCTIIGMAPLCLGSTQIGGDGPPYYPMARAIVGGLVFSTGITLVLLPTLYAMLDDWRISTRRMMRHARGLPEDGELAGAPSAPSLA
ncbi:MAG TPA: efflux RND transporter permease subunit, partial [Candidatus Saccharimonadia bacterium]|nr:efflux RND transporter permease subunit [Candidatus Saccharimonadia bacterium]